MKDIVKFTNDSNMLHFLYDAELSFRLLMLIQIADTNINCH